MPYRYVLLTALYCLGIFLLSSDSHPPFEEVQIPLKDKAAHIVLYGGLCATVSLGLRRAENRPGPWTQLLVPIGFAVLYGMSDEFHQLFVPNRTCDPADLLADAIGATLAQVFLCGIIWRIRLRQRVP